MKIIDRYLSNEVLRPFILVVVGVIVVMLSVRLSQDIELIVQHQVPIGIVARMILYKIPEFIVLGLPIAFLIGTMLGLARMSKDSEVTAIRSSGTSGKRMMVPLLLISMIVSGISYLINEEVVPRANAHSEKAKETVANIQSGENGLIQTSVSFKGVDTRFFSIQSVNKKNKTLHGILIFDSASSQSYQIISARNGSWDNTVWKLEDGVVQEYENESSQFVKDEYTFQELTVDSRIKLENYLTGEIKPKEMSAAQLQETIAAMKVGGQETQSFEVEYAAKFSNPMATFFAALIAAPIALKFARGGYIGFAISIILTFFYFVTRDIGNAAGINGFLSPLLAAWAPNILFGVVGTIFIFQVD